MLFFCKLEMFLRVFGGDLVMAVSSEIKDNPVLCNSP